MGKKVFPCRECGATVCWNPGIKRPVNADFVNLEKDEAGRTVGYTRDGIKVVGNIIDKPRIGAYMVYLPHICYEPRPGGYRRRAMPRREPCR